MHPASHGDNSAAPASRITPTRVDPAAFNSVHALAAAQDALARLALPVGAECAERRAVAAATRNVGDDLARAFADWLRDAERRADDAQAALEDAREALARALNAARDTRDAIRRARAEGEVPAVPALGDCNTRRWHPVDGWQDGNEPPEVNSPLALGIALALADAATGTGEGAREVARAAEEALDARDDADAGETYGED